jgi:hypothetical protein
VKVFGLQPNVSGQSQAQAMKHFFASRWMNDARLLSAFELKQWTDADKNAAVPDLVVSLERSCRVS